MLFCASASWLLVPAGPAATQNRRQKLNGTVTGLTHDRRVDRGTMLPMTRPRRSLWFARSRQLGSRYRHGQRHIRRSLITNQAETCAPIKSPSSLRRVSQLGARDARVSPRESLRPKQQLFAILSLLLQDMESGLGQFVGDDVVADHLSPPAPMPFQLSFVIAAHLGIAAHRVHSCLRERGFQIMIALLARPPAPRDIAGLRNARHHPAVGTENFHVGKARQFAYFIQKLRAMV